MVAQLIRKVVGIDETIEIIFIRSIDFLKLSVILSLLKLKYAKRVPRWYSFFIKYERNTLQKQLLQSSK